ncbi:MULTISPECIES: Hsp70 family protein [unclassified Shimia]|uniref:Hsp70 family protein n=1 Tax=unclassified Shimia TaxID=2630038 RepID=UPI003106B1C7
MGTKNHALGIDFGTSNSAAGFAVDGKPELITFAPGETTLPTTFFFDFDTRQTLLGSPANLALLDGVEGRFMRALKRVLGTTLMHEPRQILNQRVTFVDIIARFLRHIKQQAESQTGRTFDRALSGRPVVFHGNGDPREQQAENDLRTCYHAAGFTEVAFMAEPEAAAIANGALNANGQLGLIVDIGGGTSDFTLFRSHETGITTLANHGVRIGGTDFDRAISIDRVMPLLGRGTELRNQFGTGTHTAPNAIFNDLATWEKIPFLYTAQTRRAVDDMLRQANNPTEIARLQSTLRDELGHDIAFAVEAGKVAASTRANNPLITLAPVEPGLTAALPAEMLPTILSDHATRLHSAMQGILTETNTEASDIAQVIYVGGSSLLSVVQDTAKSLFPQADHKVAEVFTAVADGLALAAESHV